MSGAAAEPVVQPVAPMDRTTRRMTVLFVLVIALASGMVGADSAQLAPTLAAMAIAGGLLVGVYGFAPARFEVAREGGDTRLLVHRRLFGAVTFPVTGTARQAPWTFGFGGLRIGGSGGAFGWYGRFWRRDLGRFRAYVTDRSRLVAVETASGLVVCSPEDPEALLRALRRGGGRRKARR